jgi:uroporphyrinogen-III synthase
MQAKYILITRPKPEADITAKQWREMGYDCIISPVINRTSVEGYLVELERYFANNPNLNIIATSGYTVRLLSNHQATLKKTLYLTGEKLAIQAKQLGFECVYYANGSAELLIEYMNENASKQSDYLYLHSNHQAVPMVNELFKAGFRVQGLEIYHTKQSAALTGDAILALQNNQIDKVLLYSAMSAKAFIALCGDAKLLRDLQNVEAICISENVANAIPNDLFQNIKVATKTLLKI